MNKALVKVYVPFLEKSFDIFIPKNKKVYEITNLIMITIFQLSDENFDLKKGYNLVDKISGQKYDINSLIVEEDIKNGTEMILI